MRKFKENIYTLKSAELSDRCNN